MKKILITGGAGFIGSHLCEVLINSGNYVFCVDNFYTGSKKNIKHLLPNKNFKLLEHDITEKLFLKVDEIYNFACPASPIHYQKDKIFTIKTNVLGTLNMLDLAKKCKARFLQASTSEVYGDPQIHPQPESYWGNVNPIGPRSCYDEGKRITETLTVEYHNQYKVDAKIVRIFNTYGPRMAQNDGRVVSNFIIQALKNEDITIYGDGTQTRSFCYITDLLNGIIKMMNTESGYIGPVNLGNTEELTIKEIAQRIVKLTKSSSKIINLDLPQDDPKQRNPDISKAKAKLNWQPEVNINTGLMETIKYFQAHLTGKKV